jgi:tRNA1Val (adenine37-N6)-methyltransferase
MVSAADEETIDTILGGRLKLVQPKRGHRFSLDAILLGRFAQCRAGERVLELGAGCGVIALMIASLCQPASVAAIEIQPLLASMIKRNAALNQLDNVNAIEADLRIPESAHLDPASFDLIAANPPYREINSGRQSPNPGRRLARDESGASLSDFIGAAARYARHGGRFATIFAAARSAELLAELRERKLEPKRIRMVHPRVDQPASTVLIEARKNGRTGIEVEPPLIIYSAKGRYSDEARALLALEQV